MRIFIYISIATTITCCSNPASFTNSGPPRLGEDPQINLSGQGFGDHKPITLEEIEERSLPPSNEANSLAETVAQPVPITGAPLTCIVSASNETFCKMEDASQLEVEWSVYNEQEEMISSDAFEVEELPSASFWDVKIIFHEPMDKISVEISDFDEERSKNRREPKAKSKVRSADNFRQMLTGLYNSPQWGKLELTVNPDMSVTGTYKSKKLSGSIEGVLDLNEASIVGTWEERNRLGKLKFSGDIVFNIIFEDRQTFRIDGSYVNEGDDVWHDWDLVPESKDQMATLYAL